MKRPFGIRTAACDECDVDYSNAIQTMDDVLLGNRDPERWWCDKHGTEFAEDTREWLEDNGCEL